MVRDVDVVMSVVDPRQHRVERECPVGRAIGVGRDKIGGKGYSFCLSLFLSPSLSLAASLKKASARP